MANVAFLVNLIHNLTVTKESAAFSIIKHVLYLLHISSLVLNL